MTIEVTSTAFADGQPIPVKYTEDGEDVSPPIAWSGLPKGTKELVLICEDPDALTADPWIHWVIYKIPASINDLPENIAKTTHPKQVPGAFQGKNSWRIGPMIGYRGPAPPAGSGVHRYFFKVYAVEVKLVVESGLDKQRLMQEISARVIGEGQLMGTYQR